MFFFFSTVFQSYQDDERVIMKGCVQLGLKRFMHPIGIRPTHNTRGFFLYFDSKYVYPAAGHVITGNLRISSDSRIRSIIAKGPKYRFPVRIDFQKCREKLQHPLMNIVIVGVSESMLRVML